MSKGRRVVLVGSDGASPELIFAWARQGLLPVLGGMMRSGASGKLRSTVPPHSGPAWVSAITGKNPGNHGVFYFTTVNPRVSPARIVSSRDIRTETVFDILSSSGRESVVVNVPITYPPWKIEGVLVSGMFAPSEKVVFTSPPEIGPELVSSGYEVEFSTWESWEELARKRGPGKSENAEERKAAARSAYFERAMEIDNKNAAAVVGLMGRHEWDFAMVMLPGLDRIQHLLWSPAGPSEEDPAGKEFGCSRFIVEGYRNLDRLVEEIRRAAGDDAFVMVISDHGFGPTPRMFYLNRWLKSRGYLIPSGAETSRAKWIYKRGVLRSKSVMRRLTTGRPLRGPDMPAFHGLLPLSAMDLASTKAYAPTPYGLLNLNLGPGQEREKLMADLKRELESLVDPATGRPVILRVHKSSELYPGPYSGEASDILLEPEEEYYVENRVDGDEALAPAKRHPASHRPDGVLLMSGPGVRAGHEMKAAIVDVAPTVLRIISVPLSASFDGSPLDEAFEPGSAVLAEAATYRTKGAREETSDRIKRLKSEGKL